MNVRYFAAARAAGLPIFYTTQDTQPDSAPTRVTATKRRNVPRDLTFLFSRNRLNVAVSRAKALAVLVSSPRLLEVACRTVEQMRLVNGRCRFVELAGDVAHIVESD